MNKLSFGGRLAMILATLLIAAGVSHAVNYNDAPPIQGAQPPGSGLVTNPFAVGVQTPDGSVQPMQGTSAGNVIVHVDNPTSGPSAVQTVQGQDGGYPVIAHLDPSSTSAAGGGAYGEALCKGAATPDGGLPVPTLVGGLAGRRGFIARNEGPNSTWLCTDNLTCTTSTGMELKPTETFQTNSTEAVTIYCVSSTADQVAGAGLRYFEVK